MARAADRSADVLRLDPSRTGPLRRRFARDLGRALDRLRLDVADLVDREDAFGLRPARHGLVGNAWRFNTSEEKLEAFKDWLRRRYKVRVRDANDALWRKYIEDGFRQGAGRSYDDAKKGRWPAGDGDFYRGTREQFLRDSFANPASLDTLKALVARTFSDLDGVSEQMAAGMTRVLADGLVRGQNPREVARTLSASLDIAKGRAEMIARTELSRAAAEGQLTALESLGVEDVGVSVEWVTSRRGTSRKGNPSPCPACKPLEGVVLKISEARGMLPRHPGCSCSWTIAGVSEDTSDQKATKARILKAVDASKKAAGGKDGWGPGRPVSEARPQSVLNVTHADLAVLGRFLSLNYPGQPRDARGRFGTGGMPSAAEAHAGARALLAKYAAGQKLTGAEGKQLYGHLAGMTVKQLKELKAEHGVKASGRDKAALVEKVAAGLAAKLKGGAGEKPLPAFGPSKAAVNVHHDKNDPGAFERHAKDLFGPGWKLSDIASAVGAPHDSTVTVRPLPFGNGGLDVMIDHPHFDAERQIKRDGDGKKYVHNDTFFVKEGVPTGTGLGLKVFGRQVENLKAHGFDRIEAYAQRAEPDPITPSGANGYFTWPRFGYNAPLNGDHIDDAVVARARAKFPRAKTILDVMATKEGRDWWSEHGDGIHGMVFDLTDGSRSMKTLDGYRREKAAGGK